MATISAKTNTATQTIAPTTARIFSFLLLSTSTWFVATNALSSSETILLAEKISIHEKTERVAENRNPTTYPHSPKITIHTFGTNCDISTDIVATMSATYSIIPTTLTNNFLSILPH